MSALLCTSLGRIARDARGAFAVEHSFWKAPARTLSACVYFFLAAASAVAAHPTAKCDAASQPLAARVGSVKCSGSHDQGGQTSLTPRDLFERYRSGVFTIETDTGSGTGFLVGNGAVATCYHVIKGCAHVTAVAAGGAKLSLDRVVAMDEGADLAILGSSAPDRGAFFKNCVELRFFQTDGSGDPAIGDPLCVIGSPLGLDQTLTEGLLSARRTEGGIILLQLSAAISPGSSGSPVFDKHGNVVGVVKAFMRDSQLLNFAVSAHTLRERAMPGIPLGMLRTEPSGPAPAVAAASTGGGLGELVNLPHSDSTDLAGTPTFKVLVEDPDPKDILGLRLESSDVSDWVESELARSAPTAKILTDAEQSSNFFSAPADTPLKYLLAWDALVASLHVSLNVLREEGGATFYALTMEFSRGGVLPSGLARADVWSDGGFGYFGAAHDARDELRDAVQTVVKRFADKWVIANKPNAAQ